MLFMVIERFKGGDPGPVGERFHLRGRLIPEGNSIEFVASWMTSDGAACYQLMQAPSRDALDSWMVNWRDLVDFDVVEVMPSADFWAIRNAK